MEESGKEASGKEAVSTDDTDLGQLLDSCLDDFNKPLPKPMQSTTQPAKSSSANAPKGADAFNPLDGATWTEEFKQFSDAMQNVIGDESELDEIRKLMDSLSQEGIPPINDETFAQSFADTIRELTEQAQNVPDTSPEELAQLLGGLGMGASNPGDADSLPELMPLVQDVMRRLMSKDVLYPSIKEIVEKYPGWLSDNEASLKTEEFQNYKQQYEVMKKICQEFESDCDSSEEAKKKQFEKVLQLMQKVQGYGNPPKDLVSNIASGVPLDEQGNLQIPGMPQQCAIM